MSLIAINTGFLFSLGWGERPGHEIARPRIEIGLPCLAGGNSVPGLILAVGCRQLGSVQRRLVPTRGSLEGTFEQLVQEPGHRQAMTPGFMVERRDDRSRDGGHAISGSCHHGYMPQERGLLRGDVVTPPMLLNFLFVEANCHALLIIKYGRFQVSILMNCTEFNTSTLAEIE